MNSIPFMTSLQATYSASVVNSVMLFCPCECPPTVLKGIEYNSSTKGKYPNSKEIVSTGSTENCESEKWDTEVEKDKKVSFDNVTNAG